MSFQTLRSALRDADQADSTGLNNHYWAVVVNRGGVVCAWRSRAAARFAVAAQPPDCRREGVHRQRPEPRRRAAVDRAVVSRGCSRARRRNPLFGLAAGNPVSPEDAYEGSFDQFGTRNDPMVGRRVGGTDHFRRRPRPLRTATTRSAALGLSGDTACADHSTAWRLRDLLGMAPAAGNDRITLDNAAGHPHCPNDGATQGKN